MGESREKASLSPGAQPGEAERFLAENPEVVAVELLIPDLAGVFRGKRMAPEALPKAFREGVRLPGSIFGMDITGDNVDATGLTFDEGEADRICHPVPGTLKPVPWAERPRGQMLMAMYEGDGEPFFADPRHVLARVLERYAKAGLTPDVAVETEFHLFDRQPAPDGAPRFPVSPVTGRRQTAIQVYGIEELREFEPVLQEVAEACAAQGIPAETTISEFAPAQFEINLGHLPDPMRAAEHAVLLKRVVKGVAARHGLEATFMAKPLGGVASSGMHVHFSLLDRDGRNLFDDGSEAGSRMLRHAIGGLMATMAEAFALFAPNANSYRRFAPGTYAPTSADWGVNNRTASLRVPPGLPEARRIEHRVAGADANPFLVLAAALAGAFHGIEERIDPGAPVAGNAYAQREPSLPIRWGAALDAFDHARVMPEYLGADFCRVYGLCKKQERARFNARVTPLEYEWYLRTV